MITPSFLNCEALSFAYGSSQVLKGLTFSLSQNKLTALIGQSGSGKTTLFRLLAGLEKPTQGSILHTTPDSKVAYMMQDELLLPWRTVLQNIMLSNELGERISPVSAEEALTLLNQMDIGSTANLKPAQLSKGMRQRVALARAFLQKRPLLLLDEPFAALDFFTRQKMYELLMESLARTPRTTMLITHDFRDALTLADQVLLLADGQIAKAWQLTPTMRNDPHTRLKLEEEIASYCSFNGGGAPSGKAPIFCCQARNCCQTAGSCL